MATQQIVINPPPLRLTPGQWSVIGVLVLAVAGWSLFDFRIPLVDEEATVDFLIRHQLVLFTLIGIGGGALVLRRSFTIGRFQRAVLETQTHGVTAIAPNVLGPFLAPAMLPFTGGAVALFAASTAIGAAGAIPKDIGMELPPMLREAPENRSLIIFIHGWNGDAAGTWREFPALVMRDSRLNQYDVWSIDYPTFMLRRQLSVSGLAEFFTYQFLKTSRIFERYEEVVVIAHSMGGLVARAVAIQAFLRGQARSFRQLIEIGVPHEGSDPARLASTLGVSRNLTRDMASGSTYLRDFQVNWGALSVKPVTFCITSPQDNVVSMASARAHCDDGVPYMTGSHTDIVKPQSLTDVRYITPTAQIP